MHHDADNCMRWLWQRQRDRRKGLKSDAFAVARHTVNGTSRHPVEGEEEERPVSPETVGVVLEPEFYYLSVFGFRVLDVWLLHAEVEFFVEAVDQKCNVFLRVLLLVAFKLPRTFGVGSFEFSRRNKSLPLPHLFHELSKRRNKVTLVSKRVFHIDLLHVQVILYEILMHRLQVSNTLQR